MSTAGCACTFVASCTAPSPPAHTRHTQQPHGTGMPLYAASWGRSAAEGCSYTASTACTALEASARSCCTEHGWHRIPSHPEKSAFLLQCSFISMGIEPSGCVRCRPRVLLPAGAQELLPGARCPPATHAACPPVQTAPVPSPWHSTGSRSARHGARSLLPPSERKCSSLCSGNAGL